MRVDPRCKRSNELSARYHHLFRQVLERQLAQQCRQYALREPLCLGDYAFLYTVGDTDGCVSMAEVAKKLHVNPSTATRRANRLLTDGLITKSASPTDDRRYEIRLTDVGRALCASMDDFQFGIVQDAYQGVTDEQMQAVYQVMETLIKNLQNMMQDD